MIIIWETLGLESIKQIVMQGNTNMLDCINIDRKWEGLGYVRVLKKSNKDYFRKGLKIGRRWRAKPEMPYPLSHNHSDNT